MPSAALFGDYLCTRFQMMHKARMEIGPCRTALFLAKIHQNCDERQSAKTALL